MSYHPISWLTEPPQSGRVYPPPAASPAESNGDMRYVSTRQSLVVRNENDQFYTQTKISFNTCKLLELTLSKVKDTGKMLNKIRLAAKRRKRTSTTNWQSDISVGNSDSSSDLDAESESSGDDDSDSNSDSDLDSDSSDELKDEVCFVLLLREFSYYIMSCSL